MQTMTRVLGGAVLTICAVSQVWAQNYPTKPIRMLVGFPPGGGTDVVARVIAQKMSESWNSQVVVENRAGATGTIAADLIAKAAPDGYTLIMGHVNSHALAPNVFRKLPYDAVKDFAPVTYVGYVPNVLTVHPSVPARSVKELIALARAKPGALTYASSGNGSTQHVAGEMFCLQTRTIMLHVPYKGSGQAIVDLVAGHVSLNFDTMPPVLQNIKGGKLRALAVTTPKRAGPLPDVPTLKEAGLPQFEMTNWYGVMAPANTPRDIVTKLSGEILRIMQQPDARSKLEAVGTELGGGTPEEFAAFIKSEIAKYSRVAKEARITVD